MKVKGSSNTPKKGGRRTSRASSNFLDRSGEVVFCSNASDETSLVVPPAAHRPVPDSASVVGGAGQDDLENIARGGVATPFPWKLHEMLEDSAREGHESIVGWQPHGHSFLVHKPKEFVEKIMPTYFNQSKFASFQRQLNLYGFHRLSHGKDKGAYYHNCFIRNQVHLCRLMVRQKVKGTKVRRTSQAGVEPDFYTMTNIVPIDEVPPSPGTMKEEVVADNKQPTTTMKKKTNRGKGTTVVRGKNNDVKGTITKKAAKKPRKQDRRPSLPVVEKTPTPKKDEDEEMKGFPPLPQSSVLNMPELPLLPVGRDHHHHQQQEQQQQQQQHQTTTTTAAVPALLPPPSPTCSPPLQQRRADVISAKERAHRLRQEREQRERQEREEQRQRQERLNAVRDALKQTEMLFGDGDDDVHSFVGGCGNNNHINTSTASRRGSSTSSSSLQTISIKPMIPSVSPLESEVSDFEDDSSNSVFPPLRFHHHQKKQEGGNPSSSTANMPPLVANPPPIPATLEPLAFNKPEPLVPRFTTTHARETMKMAAAAEGIDIKAGDVLFFEGKPFRYLEHLDSLPPPPPSISSSASGRPVVSCSSSSVPKTAAVAAASAAEMQKPKTWNTMAYPTFGGAFGGNAAGGFPRDSLQSLMRVDPQAIFNFNIRPMP